MTADLDRLVDSVIDGVIQLQRAIHADPEIGGAAWPDPRHDRAGDASGDRETIAGSIRRPKC